MFTIQSTPTVADVYLLKSSQENNAKAFKPSHNSNIFYITVQNNAELDQRRSMAESPREILSSNRQISPAQKNGFERLINPSTLSVEVRLQNSFLLHNLYWKWPREGPKGELRGGQIDCGIREILNYN